MSTMPIDVHQEIRTCLRQHADLVLDVDAINDGQDLYKAGLSSQGTVNLMLGLEDAFDVEFPDAMLRRQTFQSVNAIADAIGDLMRKHVGRDAHG